MSVNNIPLLTKLPVALDELAEKKIWVNHGIKKLPINPNTLYAGSTVKPERWSDYETASHNIGKVGNIVCKGKFDKEIITGVGIIINEKTGLSLCGIDLDHVIVGGRLTDEAQKIVTMMDSYTEISTSGTGIHILFYGDLSSFITSKSGAKVEVPHGLGYEMYCSARYFIVTGNEFGNHERIESRTIEAKSVFETYYLPHMSKASTVSVSVPSPATKLPSSHSTARKDDQSSCVDAIKKRDIEFLRNYLHSQAVTISTKKQFFDYIYTRDLSELLGVPKDTPFCCILPGHTDTHPSASIFTDNVSEKHYQHYKCFSDCREDGTTYNIKELIKILGGFESDYEVLEFIKAIYNIILTLDEKFNSAIQSIDEMLKHLNTDPADLERFEYVCPRANHNLRFCKEVYFHILLIVKSCITAGNILYDQDKIKIIFYMSYNQLYHDCTVASKDKLVKKVKTLCYHKLIEVLPDDKIPQSSLQRALSGRTNAKHNRVNFYALTIWTDPKAAESIEAAAERWILNGYTQKGVSREMFLRAEGEEVAASLYPQTSVITTPAGDAITRPIPKTSESRHSEIEAFILERIALNGYVFKKDVLSYFGPHYDEQVARSLQDICNSNNLYMCRATKKIKKAFGLIELLGAPIIIFPIKTS